MREYGSVSPRFWIGETGKMLRGNPEAQVLALYLMTSPHANMIGIFHCPILYMAHETGLTEKGASKALARLSEAGFCVYDAPSETVFVLRMAAFQVGEQLKEDDNKVKGIRKEYDRIAVQSLKDRFHEIYQEHFHLPEKPLGSPFIAPSKQLTGTGQEQDSVMSGKPDFGREAKQVLEYLNEKTGSGFEQVDSNLTPIKARLKEYDKDRLLAVIDAKSQEWLGTDMAKFLRPETLFRAGKCASYVGQLGNSSGPRVDE
jgi:uncharacterized phage protein (TIGR02220 family)